MQITRTTVPGTGTLHHCHTRSGDRIGVLVTGEGKRTIMVYNGEDPDTPAQTVTLESDEADILADLLHSTSIADRLAAVERRLGMADHPR